MALRKVVPLVVVIGVALLPPKASGQEASLESQVLSLINAERSTALIPHQGLIAEARGHSQEMSQTGGLDHNDADQRVMTAAPDPPQGSGPPDAGFPPAAWCEDVTYVMAKPESEVAQQIYQQWHTSAPHDACMRDARKNVAGVGIYYDGQTWWATFVAEVDTTPPGGAAPPAATSAPAATAGPLQSPVASNSAQQAGAGTSAGTPSSGNARSTSNTSTSAVRSFTAVAPSTPAVSDPPPAGYTTIRTEVSALAEPHERTGSRRTPGFELQDIGGVGGVIAVAMLMLLRPVGSVQLPPEVERRDHVPLPEVEPVGAGAGRS